MEQTKITTLEVVEGSRVESYPHLREQGNHKSFPSLVRLSGNESLDKTGIELQLGERHHLALGCTVPGPAAMARAEGNEQLDGFIAPKRLHSRRVGSMSRSNCSFLPDSGQ